jgi:hypothetical protein
LLITCPPPLPLSNNGTSHAVSFLYATKTPHPHR